MDSSVPSLDTTAQNSENAPAFLKSPVTGFYIVAVLFNCCLIVQVLTVGLAVFDSPNWWNTHVWLIRGYGGLSLVLLALAYWISFPKRIRMLALSLPILLSLQFPTIHEQLPLPFSIAILHPLIGFALFSASTTLVHRVRYILFPAKDQNTDTII